MSKIIIFKSKTPNRTEDQDLPDKTKVNYEWDEHPIKVVHQDIVVKGNESAFDKYFKRVDGKFNLELSEYASGLLQNKNGTSHIWSPNQINDNLHSLSIDIPDYLSLGDITYLANWTYSKFYPDFVHSDLSCMNFIGLWIKSKILYQGLILKTWSKFMDREYHDEFISINWEEF